ncbi:TPA: hypothetical protein ACKQPR_005010 [Serratia odorifera]|nr:hypothetical protein [Serratia odorifera]HEJ9098266.1 hypothetical protein [Serratia odorifera]
MPKTLLIALSVIALAGCGSHDDNYTLDDVSAADTSADKQWKEFVAPLSVKTQSPNDRMIKRAERQR